MMIDFKMVELFVYNDILYLLIFVVINLCKVSKVF